MMHEAITEHMDLGGGTTIRPLEADLSDEFDLTLVLWRGSTGLSGEIQYDRDRFDEQTIRRMAGHYQRLLASGATKPDVRLSQLAMLPEQEVRELLVAFNATSVERPQSLCLHQLFEVNAERDPQAIAVCAGSAQLSYGELNCRANQLAHRLRALGAGAETRIGICLERSLETFIAVLGVLKAGAAYVPLDPVHSSQRLEYMLHDSGVSLVVTSSQQLPILSGLDLPLVQLDGDREQLDRLSTANPGPRATPDNLAYVMYTSGSTGEPKGALIPHRNLVNAYLAWEETYRLRREAKCHLQMASFSFDVFAGDFLRALGSGARLVLCPREVLLNPAELYALLRREAVDCAEFVPAVVRALMQYLEQTGQSLEFMRLVIVGSDSWTVGEFEQLLRYCGSQTRLINSYGVAEATIDSSYFEGATGDLPAERLVPLGRPFANTQMYVLDRHMQPLPVGVAGELYLGGEGLARCYLNRPGLTAQKFVPHPFTTVPGARLYRTGDRARWLAEGKLEFLGRADHQIKIRGFRIEPGEIETVLTRHSAVQQALVIAREADSRDKQLAAYVVPREMSESPERLATELRQHLGQRLPDYMVPAWIVVLEQFPLSRNGKIDRRALPAPQELQPVNTFVAPQSDVEQRIATIWSELLGVERVGLGDNFFDLGGHSLLLFQLQNKLREAFDQELALVDLFRLPTVQAQAQQFAGSTRVAERAFEQARQRVEKQKQALARKQQLARTRRTPR
jgi:amino acid adenylation domain-containing protein